MNTNELSMEKNKKLEEFRQILQESLRFSLYSRDWLERYGSSGLKLMQQLSDIGYHLPLFAAVDTICSFLSDSLGYYPHLTLLPVKDAHFQNIYANVYQEYLNKIRKSSDFNKITENLRDFERRRFIRSDQGNLADEDKLIYQAFYFILIETTMKCPFMNIVPLYDPTMLVQISWESLHLPERKEFSSEKEKMLLARLRLDECKFKPLPMEGNSEKRMRILAETCFQVYEGRVQEHLQSKGSSIRAGERRPEEEEKLLQHQEKERLRDISLTQHLFDYKLIDLYIDFHDKYEPGDPLRRKIAQLERLSRVAIERSPFNSEYSRQERTGIPNPAHLGQGWLRFFLKALEGHPIFLGYPDPIREQDNLAVRFHFIEEVKSATEKLKEGTLCRFPHVTIHKLISLLLSHDLVKYLGGISEIDIVMKFFIYRVTKQDLPDTGPDAQIKMKDLRKRYGTDGGFLTKAKELQRALFLEAAVLEITSFKFDHRFFEKYFDYIDSSTKASIGYKRIYDIFFGRGGTYLHENNYSSGDTGEVGYDHIIQKEEFSPSTGIRDVLRDKAFRTLPCHPTSFIFETNYRYLLVTGHPCNPYVFTTQAVGNKLSDFLNVTREYFLNLIVDEAIRLKRGYLERMRW